MESIYTSEYDGFHQEDHYLVGVEVGEEGRREKCEA